MARLVTFGCSHTFGQYLPDIQDNHSVASKLAWPSLLANKLNLELDNQAIPGISNIGILESIIKYDFTKEDYAIVMWTYYDRDRIWDMDGKPHNYQFAHISKFSTKSKWLDVHNPIDTRIRSWFYIHHAKILFESKLDKFLMLLIHHDPEFIIHKPYFITDIDFPKIYFCDYIKILPKALDENHGGVNCHRYFALDLFTLIGNMK